MEISKNQKEILDMILKEYMTVKAIANRRQTSTQNIYNVIRKLKKKGLISGNQKSGYKLGDYLGGGWLQKVRLHGQVFHINIGKPSQTYNKIKKDRNRLKIDNNTILLYKDTIMIYCSPNRDFEGEDATQASIKAEKYWREFFCRIEELLQLQRMRIKEVSSHYAETSNELAKDQNKKGQQIKIKAPEDSKTWLLTDNSFKMEELETIHPETSKDDMDKIKPFFNDLRDNPVLLSDILKVIKIVAEQHKETASGLNAVVTLLKPKEEMQIDKHNRKIPDYIN